MWFICLLQLGCMLALRLYLEHSRGSGQSNMSYTSFAQKPHFLFRNNICCFCVERHCFILHAVYFPSPLSWTTAYLLEKKLNSCEWFGLSKKVLAFVQCACSVFTSCLCAKHTQTPTGIRAHFCCTFGFFKLVLVHTVSCCNKMDSDSASLRPDHVPIQQVV